MADALVTCITLAPGATSHERITMVGGPAWRWPVANVIASIRAGTNTFHTMVDGHRAEIGVNDGPSGPYLRSYADGVWNNNLLALPRCA